jgi:hypothetical protein
MADYVFRNALVLAGLALILLQVFVWFGWVTLPSSGKPGNAAEQSDFLPEVLKRFPLLIVGLLLILLGIAVAGLIG